MGYNLSIGNAKIECESNDHYICISCDIVRVDDAPDYGDVNGKMNIRWPSYSQWANFAQEVNLHEFFFNKDSGVMRNHPGEYFLTEDDYQVIKDAKVEYVNKYGTDLIDIENYIMSDVSEDVDIIKYNFIRLHWLEYWVRYALDHYEYPIFKNS